MIPIAPTWIAAGVAGTLAIGAIGVQQYRINSCRADLAEARTIVAGLSAQIEQQNQAVKTWQDKAVAAQAAAAQEQRVAAERAKGTKIQIARLQGLLALRWA